MSDSTNNYNPSNFDFDPSFRKMDLDSFTLSQAEFAFNTLISYLDFDKLEILITESLEFKDDWLLLCAIAISVPQMEELGYSMSKYDVRALITVHHWNWMLPPLKEDEWNANAYETFKKMIANKNPNSDLFEDKEASERSNGDIVVNAMHMVDQIREELSDLM